MIMENKWNSSEVRCSDTYRSHFEQANWIWSVRYKVCCLMRFLFFFSSVAAADTCVNGAAEAVKVQEALKLCFRRSSEENLSRMESRRGLTTHSHAAPRPRQPPWLQRSDWHRSRRIVSARVKNIMQPQCRHGDKGRPIRCLSAARLLKNTRKSWASLCVSAAIGTSAGRSGNVTLFLAFLCFSVSRWVALR